VPRKRYRGFESPPLRSLAGLFQREARSVRPGFGVQGGRGGGGGICAGGSRRCGSAVGQAGTFFLMRIPRDISGRFLTMRTVAAPPIHVGRWVLTPSARTVALRCGPGLFIRSWPLAVVVTEAGRTSRVRIRDMTRLIQVAIVSGVGICAYGLRARALLRKENTP
jgi:hypothetical protein